MLRLIKIEGKDDYRIEGLNSLQVLRIYESLKSVNKNSGYIMELDVMVNCLKMDINNLYKTSI